MDARGPLVLGYARETIREGWVGWWSGQSAAMLRVEREQAEKGGGFAFHFLLFPPPCHPACPALDSTKENA